MTLFKIDDRYPDYRERFAGGDDIMGVDVYVRTDDGDDKVGNIHTVLVDEAGRVRYLVVDTGFWVFGKKVLLPIGRCTDDPAHNRIYAVNLSKQQVENLPEYTDKMVVDYDYEERVRSVYLSPPAGRSAPVETSASVEGANVKGYRVAPAPPTSPAVAASSKVLGTPAPDADVYDRTPELYETSDENHHRLRLYEERLVAEKHRQKTGEVTVTKRVETEQAEASVPVQKEKVVIEIESAVGATQVNTPKGSFQDGEITQMDLYEEQADIHKASVVHQDVNIRKEIDKDVVTAEETLRREELDVQQDGSPDVIDRSR